MKIKKIIWTLVVLGITAFFTLSAFAAGSSMEIEATTTLGNEPDFTVSIPVSIPMEDIQRTAESSIQSKSFSVQVVNDKGLQGKCIDVFVAVPNDEFALYYDVYRLPYHLYNQESGGDPLNSGDLFASFTQQGTVTGRVEVDEMNIPATGTYSGSLQFIVTVKDQ